MIWSHEAQGVSVPEGRLEAMRSVDTFPPVVGLVVDAERPGDLGLQEVNEWHSGIRLVIRDYVPGTAGKAQEDAVLTMPANCPSGIWIHQIQPAVGELDHEGQDVSRTQRFLRRGIWRRRCSSPKVTE